MKKQKNIIFIIVNILLCLLLFVGCENNITSFDMSSDNQNSSEAETILIQENSMESMDEINESIVSSEEIESTESVTEQLSKVDSTTEDILSVVNSNENDSMNADLESLSLSSIKEFEDWILGKNEFSARHQQYKIDINKNDCFFDKGIYYKLNEKLIDFKINKIEFYWGQYCLFYSSESMSIYYDCSYGAESTKLLLDDLARRKATATNVKYTDIEYNNIKYTVKESDKSGITRIIWMQDDVFMDVVFPGTKYTPELLDYCVAQKVDLNNIVKSTF